MAPRDYLDEGGNMTPKNYHYKFAKDPIAFLPVTLPALGNTPDSF